MNIDDIINKHNYSQIETDLVENFSDHYIHDAHRVAVSKIIKPEDYQMMYDAVCVLVAMYMKKINEGLIEDRILH